MQIKFSSHQHFRVTEQQNGEASSETQSPPPLLPLSSPHANGLADGSFAALTALILVPQVSIRSPRRHLSCDDCSIHEPIASRRPGRDGERGDGSGCLRQVVIGNHLEKCQFMAFGEKANADTNKYEDLKIPTKF